MMKHTRKTLSHLAAMFLSVMLLAALAIVPAGAVDGDGEGDTTTTTPITSIGVDKIITTDGDTYAPATSFEFTVRKGDAVEDFNDGTNTTVDVSEGVTGGLTGTTITTAPNTDAETAASYTFSGSLAVDITMFSKPGVYHYVVTEVTPEVGYEGIDYSTESYDVYVYVVNGTDGLEVDAVIAFKNGTKVDKIEFTNNYGAGDTPEDDGKIHDVTITKYVEGNLADLTNDSFSFTVGVVGVNGETYKVVYTNNGVLTTTYVMSGSTITVNGLKDEDTITIYGLSEGDTYTVTETNGVSQGYTVTDTVGEDDGVVSGNVTVDGDTESIINAKNASTPTGIITTFAPYALMVVVAAAACFFFLRRRNAAED